MTRVTCPKCSHTFEINNSQYNLRSINPVWTKYSNSQGLKCECDCCKGLFDEVYLYYDNDYNKDTPLACYTKLPPFRRFVCKDCIRKFLSREQLQEIERDGYIY